MGEHKNGGRAVKPIVHPAITAGSKHETHGSPAAASGRGETGRDCARAPSRQPKEHDTRMTASKESVLLWGADKLSFVAKDDGYNLVGPTAACNSQRLRSVAGTWPKSAQVSWKHRCTLCLLRAEVITMNAQGRTHM